METMRTKYCARCEQTLSIDKFTKSAARYDGLQGYCSECMKKYRREHYSKNKDQYVERNNRYKSELREVILELKSKPCPDCGRSFPDEPWLMELDHIDPSTKEHNISSLAHNNQRSKLKEELKKCEAVCLICHRRRTAKHFQWKKNRFDDIM